MTATASGIVVITGMGSIGQSLALISSGAHHVVFIGRRASHDQTVSFFFVKIAALLIMDSTGY